MLNKLVYEHDTLLMFTTWQLAIMVACPFQLGCGQPLVGCGLPLLAIFLAEPSHLGALRVLPLH